MQTMGGNEIVAEQEGPIEPTTPRQEAIDLLVAILMATTGRMPREADRLVDTLIKAARTPYAESVRVTANSDHVEVINHEIQEQPISVPQAKESKKGSKP